MKLIPPARSAPRRPESRGVEGAERHLGARSKQIRDCVGAPRQTVANECSWPCWRTATTPGHHCLFRGSWSEEALVRCLDILTIKWVTADLSEECRILLNTQLMSLKKEKDPTAKQFDDDEWIRSLQEAQEVTTDVPEDSVTCDQQDVDPKKVRPIQMGEFLRKYVSRRLLAHSVREKVKP